MELDDLKQEIRAVLEQLETLDEEALNDEVASSAAKALRASAHTFGWLIGSANPTLITCDMPYNRHTFFAGSKTKRCSHCSLIFCPDHKISHCVSCGLVL